MTKAELAARIAGIIASRKLTQAAAGEILGVDQPKVSALLRGRGRSRGGGARAAFGPGAGRPPHERSADDPPRHARQCTKRRRNRDTTPGDRLPRRADRHSALRAPCSFAGNAHRKVGI
ncbi:MAG: XRE family transcriptional regulator [Deltaproteobacteria bacterium]